MSIKTPATYGDFYWLQSVEASIAQAEQYEQELSPFVKDIIGDIIPTADLPPAITRMLNVMAEPPHPAWSTIMSGWTSNLSSQVSGNALSHALLDFNYKMAEKFADLRIDPSVACNLWSRKKITQGMFDARMKSGGLKEAEAAAFYESTQPYPSIPDIMTWARYNSDPFNIRSVVWDKYNVNTEDFALWEWLSGVRLTTSECQTLFKRGLYTEGELGYALGCIGYGKEDIPLVKNLSYTIPNAMLLVQSDLFNGRSESDILNRISMADIHPDFADDYFNAVLTKPSAQDIITLQLRYDPQLTNLGGELRKIGIHPAYHNLYKELAYQIPPVADIITMAVREAFTPSIASKFGQYEELPSDYVKYAGMKGLSKEWAERYWAAHWNLPSPQQGFEMLQRGIITKDELNMLLHALDVMPFWRNKLIQMCYNLYTRVDVRRMYSAGVLDKKGVYEAYVEMGYEDKKAQKLTDFTVQSQISSLSGVTSKTVVNSYAKGLISEGDASRLLAGMGLTSQDVSSVMQLANHKKEWELKELKISSIEALYKKKKISKSEAQSQLSIIGITANEVNLMLDKWTLSEKVIEPATWTTSQTLALFKKGIITQNRAIQELTDLDYDDEHIAGLMANAQSTI